MADLMASASVDLVSTYSTDFSTFVSLLNKQQLDVVNFGAGCACVIGTPGAGKTATVVARIVRLIKDGYNPELILAMTFTRNAAYEMNTRLQHFGVTAVRVGTIHSVCRQILATETNLLNQYYIDDKFKLPLELRKTLNDFRKRKRIPNRGTDIEAVERFIAACKAGGICYIWGDPFGINSMSDSYILSHALDYAYTTGISAERLHEIYTEFERRRAIIGLMDYDDMLLWAWLTLVTNEAACVRWRHKWGVVIVDEVQDSSAVQWDIARFLAGLKSGIIGAEQGNKRLTTNSTDILTSTNETHNLMVVGDTSQCLDLNTLVEVGENNELCSLNDVPVGAMVSASKGGLVEKGEVLRKGVVVKAKHARITLDDGRILDGSADHLVFAAITDRADHYYTYLSFRHGLGFRLSYTFNVSHVPLNLYLYYSDADKFWLLSAHDTQEEMQQQLCKFADQYRIPIESQLVETNQGGTIKSDAIDGHRLLCDLYLLEMHPLWMAEILSNQTIGIEITLGKHGLLVADLCVRSKAVYSFEVQKVLHSLLGVPLDNIFCANFESGVEAHACALQLKTSLKEVTDCPIEMSIVLSNAHGPIENKFTATALSGLVPGTLVWTSDGQARRVVALQRYKKTKHVGDIQVDKLTNFFANGIAVHNSIYAWRNAVPKQMLDFYNHKDVTKFVLPINYRSNQTICTLASQMVTNRKWHLAGSIQSAVGNHDINAVQICEYSDPLDEAEAVVLQAQEYAVTEGLRSCAVLARLKISLDLIELVCIRKRLKYIKMAKGSFFDSKEVLDLLAYLRVAAGCDPSNQWLKRIINKPFRYIGRPYIDMCEERAVSLGISFLDSIMLHADTLSFAQHQALKKFYELLIALNRMIVETQEALLHSEAQVARETDYLEKISAAQVAQTDDLLSELAAVDVPLPASTPVTSTVEEQKQAATKDGRKDASTKASEGALDAVAAKLRKLIVSPGEMIRHILQKTDYIEELRREEGLLGEDESKLAVLASLQRMAESFRSVYEFLSYIDTLATAVAGAAKTGLKVKDESTEDALILSTIHSAKGTEFNNVFIVDVVQGRFPSVRTEEPEEELRLFYVAMTRAAKRLHISYAQKPAMPSGEKSEVSEFVRELQLHLARYKKQLGIVEA
jgi:superfamily I DNA/RNA helicase